jgi:hypothetical protein
MALENEFSMPLFVRETPKEFQAEPTIAIAVRHLAWPSRSQTIEARQTALCPDYRCCNDAFVLVADSTGRIYNCEAVSRTVGLAWPLRAVILVALCRPTSLTNIYLHLFGEVVDSAISMTSSVFKSNNINTLITCDKNMSGSTARWDHNFCI